MTRVFRIVCLIVLASMMRPAAIFAQGRRYAGGAQTPSLITRPVDDNATVVLARNTRPEAVAANDGGMVPDSLRN